jgi:hypothetical protein
MGRSRTPALMACHMSLPELVINEMGDGSLESVLGLMYSFGIDSGRRGRPICPPDFGLFIV